MDLDEVIGRRRMCRDFMDRAVPDEVLDRLLDRARRAPSAGFSQGVSFLVLSRPDETGRFWDAVSEPGWRADPSLPGLMRAPVIVVPMCSPAVYVARYSEQDKIAFGLDREEAWPVPFWTVDAAFATMILLLGAVEEGLGALFFGRMAEDYERVRSVFGVPDEWSAIGFVALGWPAADGGPRGSARRGRKPLSTVVHRGRWGG